LAELSSPRLHPGKRSVQGDLSAATVFITVAGCALSLEKEDTCFRLSFWKPLCSKRRHLFWSPEENRECWRCL